MDATWIGVLSQNCILGQPAFQSRSRFCCAIKLTVFSSSRSTLRLDLRCLVSILQNRWSTWILCVLCTARPTLYLFVMLATSISDAENDTWCIRKHRERLGSMRHRGKGQGGRGQGSCRGCPAALTEGAAAASCGARAKQRLQRPSAVAVLCCAT